MCLFTTSLVISRTPDILVPEKVILQKISTRKLMPQRHRDWDGSLPVMQFLISFSVVQETLKYYVDWFSLPPNSGETRKSEGDVLLSITYLNKSIVSLMCFLSKIWECNLLPSTYRFLALTFLSCFSSYLYIYQSHFVLHKFTKFTIIHSPEK